jgi:hypothetical protein
MGWQLAREQLLWIVCESEGQDFKKARENFKRAKERQYKSDGTVQI